MHKDRGFSISCQMSRGLHGSSSMSTKPVRTPDRGAIVRIAGSVLKTTSVAVELRNGCLYRTVFIRGKGDSFCLMRSTPDRLLRLLRIEESRLAVEALALELLQRHRTVTAPTLLDHHVGSAASHLISGPFNGIILSDLDRPLSNRRQATFDRSLGRYICRLSSIIGPGFGPLARPSITSWARCFALMLDSVLCDAEDSLISLPYDGIRMFVRKHARSLDRITQPRLVLVEAADEDNIVCDNTNNQVVSLLDYGSAVWGDPFLSDCFCQSSAALLEGYGEGTVDDPDHRIRHLL
jgi:hypothetical protein